LLIKIKNLYNNKYYNENEVVGPVNKEQIKNIYIYDYRSGKKFILDISQWYRTIF